MLFNIFGDHLRKLRNSYGLSQVELSRLLSLKSHNGVARWETGRSGPTVEKLTEIANFFAVSTDWLLGRSTVLYSADVVKTAEEKVIEALQRVHKNENSAIFYKGYIGYFLKHITEQLPYLPYGDEERRNNEYTLEVRANIVVLAQIIFISYIKGIEASIHAFNESRNKDKDSKVPEALFLPMTMQQIDKYGELMNEIGSLFFQKRITPIYRVTEDE